MANTYELIASVTVGAGGSASMDFNSIPSTYTDLLLKVSVRNTNATGDSLAIKFNGATSGYSDRWLYGNGSTAASSSDTASPMAISYADVIGSSATANTFSNIEIYIPNYAGSTYKSVSSDGVGENNTTQAYSSLFAGLWSNTAAINAISLVCYSGAGYNFAQYSTAYLYGVKNA